MQPAGCGRGYLVWLILGLLLGCSPAPAPPLSPGTAQQTLDSWNPSYCKVSEFIGFHRSEEGGGQTLVAYVQVLNPADPKRKQTVFAARFQLLTRPNGRRQWFLTSLTSHGSGLSPRQGWDNLMIPVKDSPPASAP